ncbi:MAG: ABC transporter permease [Tannerellaceae bacterium]|jgi:putative ABC transport system permease protein|nr:ABC transporter permease [Tannerellaceae bacterium]
MIKQTWNLLRQEKVFSAIYILGTGLSITVVMAMAIVFYIRIADVYPETNRSRMLIVKSGTERLENGGWNSASLSDAYIEACFRSLESAEAVGAVYREWEDEHYVQPEGSSLQWPVEVKHVDDGFWRVFPFRFLNGKPFGAPEFQSGLPVAVIASSLARRLFGTDEAEGRYVSLDYHPYRVCGVVKDASYATEQTYAQLWLPYTLLPDYKGSFGESGALGHIRAYILAPSAGEVGRVKEEALEHIRRYAAQFDKVELSLNGQPDRHWQSAFRFWSSDDPDFGKILLQYGLIFLFLLLVPAVSLSGMTDSRMERRLAEMGVRRAFGAPRTTLTGQIVAENFFFTLFGGIFGLLLSYLLILAGRNWIMEIGVAYVEIPPEGSEVLFTPAMLLNLPVFGMALAVCFLLNLFSALIPAWKASHRAIVHSLNT